MTPVTRSARDLFLGLVAIAMIAGTAGCNAGPFGGSALLLDTQSDQPWWDESHRAHMDSGMTWDFVGIHYRAQWTGSDSPPRSVSDVARECESFAPRDPIGFDDSRAVSNGVPITYHRGLRFADTRTIVCLDPLIVLCAPGESAGPLDDADVVDLQTRFTAYLKLGWANIRPPYGYRYGTHVGPATPLTWYSPTLGAAPRPIEPLPDGHAHIPVPWGHLDLRPSSGGWEIVPVRSHRSG